MGCPDDAFLLALVEGDLDADRLASADRHLDGCPDCRDLVAELIRAAGGGGTLPPGAEIDRYRIVDVLGRGAMGVVYAAFDPELDRPVALKLLRDELASRRLLDEARAMARLAHPNVVSVYDARTCDGAPLIAMELVEGRSVREWLAAERPDWPRIRDVFAAAGRGLAAAHRANLVHRDFKPDNVLVGDDGAVRVGDFGLAITDGDGGAEVAGTPAYMAPEQRDGRGADARSDQYSFCAALYEALSGDRPEPDPAPIGRVPRRLDRAIARGLDPDPERRWPDLESLVDALERRPPRVAPIVAAALGALAIAGLWAAARGDETPAVEPCAGARSAVAAAWSPSRAAALKAAVGESGARYEQPALAALVAELDSWRDRWVETRTRVCRATRVEGTQSPRLLDVRMHCLDRGLRRARALVAELERAGGAALPALPAVIGRLPPPDACASAALTLREPPTALQAQKLPALERRVAAIDAAVAVGQHQRALELAGPLVGDAIELGYAPLIAEVRLARARALRALDRRADATAEVREALVAAEGAAAERLAIEAMIASASMAVEAGELDRAEHHRRIAAAALSRTDAPPALEVSMARVAGLVHLHRGELGAAREALERARELTGDGVGAAAVLAALGNVDRAAGDLESALARHRRAGQLDRARFGDRHPAVARDLHNQAGILRRLGRADEALARYRQALEIKREALGGAHSEIALTRNSIALIHLERGELDAAAAQLDAALEIYRGLGRPERAGVLRNLGLVAERRGERRAARQRFEAALAVGSPSVSADQLRADLARVAPRPAPPAKEPEPPPTYMPGQVWD